MSDPTGTPTGIPSGMDSVDQALAPLADLETRPVGEHPAVFESVHDALRAVLSGDPRA